MQTYECACLYICTGCLQGRIQEFTRGDRNCFGAKREKKMFAHLYKFLALPSGEAGGTLENINFDLTQVLRSSFIICTIKI